MLYCLMKPEKHSQKLSQASLMQSQLGLHPSLLKFVVQKQPPTLPLDSITETLPQLPHRPCLDSRYRVRLRERHIDTGIQSADGRDE
jgi:hypothetical protein